jgi:hypothetical protein
MTNTTTDTTILRMSADAWNLLVANHDWAEPDPDGPGGVTWETTDGTVTVTIKTESCQSIDIVEAANHCLHNLEGRPDVVVEVVAHDGSIA